MSTEKVIKDLEAEQTKINIMFSAANKNEKLYLKNKQKEVINLYLSNINKKKKKGK